jgi:hydroxymethylpyrimidine/phosphomethylpyrimidine kinase
MRTGVPPNGRLAHRVHLEQVMIVRALSIAGSDPSGGAGIQADLKSFAAHGAYGMAAIASLTAQNTRGVRGVFSPPAEFLAEQLTAISDDIVVDTVKIGMLGNAANVAVVAEWLTEHRPEYVVLDPVMVATSGDRLLDPDAELAITRLLSLADVITPNLAELAVLVGEPAAPDLQAAIAQGQRLAARTGTRVLVKGGHLPGTAQATDALVNPDGTRTLLPGTWVDTRNTHGTGCSLSSALAALRPQRPSWVAAAADAKAWLSGALLASDQLAVGGGAGPVHHLHHLWPPAQQVSAQQVSAEPFCTGMWRQIEPIRDAIETMPFVRALADGSLPWPNFRFYLAQDAHYLRQYARCLARVAALAPDQDAQEFFAHASAGALDAELTLHRSLLSQHGESLEGVEVSPVTAAYVDHLHRACAAGDYAAAIAAVLPCFWLYQHIGERLAGLRAHAGTTDHPYAAWIDTYADPAFADLTTTAISLTDRAAARASADQLAVMAEAFERSSRYEWMFFAQGTDMLGWPV